MNRAFLERLGSAPLVFDGAMGTVLYERGVFVNTCYDEVCLTRPDLVRGVHADYVAAGADVIETNSFGANRVKLRRFGLAEQVEAINRAAVALAREAAGDEVLVAGSVGPCLHPGQMWRSERAEELAEAFAEQCGILADAGVDLLVLETFSVVEEARCAAAAARATGCPVLLSFAFGPRGETALGTGVAAVMGTVDGWEEVDAVGINCGVGPAPIYDLVEQALAATGKPLVVMPNAGMPKDVDGRLIYMTSPEYFTEYAKRFIEQGVRGVGGCCGTTPAHIRVASQAVHALAGVRRRVEIRAVAPDAVEVEVVPAAEKSRFARRLLRGLPVSSVELVPPRSCDLSGLLQRARQCRERGVDAINIPDGPRASARVSPMVAAMAIEKEVGIETILHYCCRDRNLIGMQSDLLGAYVAGLRNLLIITGDPPKLGDYPDATAVFDVDAIGLTQVAFHLNHGRDIGGNPVSTPTGLFLGVGANPCAVDPRREIDRFHAKAAAGAEFAMTQPVFDVEALFRFLDRVEGGGTRIPVLAGVWPLVSFKNAEFMRNEVPGVEIPDAVMERMRACRTKEDGIRAGIDIAREIRDRVAERVAGFQVSAPFGKVEIALEVLGETLSPAADEQATTGG